MLRASARELYLPVPLFHSWYGVAENQSGLLWGSELNVNLELLNGNGSFRPRVVSALSRFGPGSFRPGSIRPWVVSAQFGGSFRPIFSQLSGLLPKVN